MFKRGLSLALAFIMLLTVPVQAFAAQGDMLVPELSQGRNSFEPKVQTPLSEAEIKAIRDELAAKYTVTAANADTQPPPSGDAQGDPLMQPFSAATVESTRFKLYPIVTKENNYYTFKGLFVGGEIDDNDFVSLTYQLQPDSMDTTVLEANSIESTNKFPDSTLFDPLYDHYKKTTDNWQSDALLTALETDTLYSFSLQFDPDTQGFRGFAPSIALEKLLIEEAEQEEAQEKEAQEKEAQEAIDELNEPEPSEGDAEQKPAGTPEAPAAVSLLSIPQPPPDPPDSETGEEREEDEEEDNGQEAGEEESLLETPAPPEEPLQAAQLQLYAANALLTSESFLLYMLKPGDTLIRVSGHYGVPLATILEDNAIAPEDTLLKPGDTLFLREPVTDKPLSTAASAQGGAMSYYLGGQGSTEFAYNLVNMSTGNLFYSYDDVTLEEYEGFTISRQYNSQAAEVDSLFGYGFATNLGIRLAALEGDAYLLTLGDGKEIKLVLSTPGIYVAADERYTLNTATMRVTDNKQTIYQFNAYGQISSITDRGGLPVEYEYDAEQQLSAIFSKSGVRFSITLNDRGLVERIGKPDDTWILYDYDGEGRLAKVTGESGNATTYTYKEGRLTDETNALHNAVFAAEYDSGGRVTAYRDGGGSRTTFAYEGSAICMTDSLNNTKVYTHDGRYNLTSILFADSTEETREYDERDRVTKLVNRNLDQTSYTYNGRDDIASIIHNGLTIANYTFDAKGNIETYTDSNEKETHYTYDGRGNNESITFPDGTTQTMKYDNRNRLTELTMPGGDTITYTYEGDSPNVAAITDAKGHTTTYKYDEMNRLTESKSPSGTVVTYTYTPTGLLASKTVGDKTERYTYDAVGNNIGTTDPNGHESFFEYDENGRLIRATVGTDEQVSFEYDGNGNLIKETNGKGEATEYEYDAQGNRTKETAADGSVTQFEYDKKNRVIKETDEDGASIEYNYHDVLDEVVWKKDKLGREESYEYDNAGNLIETVYPDGIKVTNTYDSMNRLTSSTDERGIKTSYTYDEKGNITEQSDATGRTKKYEYDANGNLTKESNVLKGDIDDIEYPYAEYTYNESNWLLSATDAEGNASTYEYDEMGQVTKETDRADSVKAYTYDDTGNIATMTDGNGNTTTYAYDAKNRVILETNAADHVFGAVYDGAGNMVNTIDPFGNVTTYEYDAKQRLTKITDALGNSTAYEYDRDGNRTKLIRQDGEETVYTYNKIGWLTEITAPGGLITTYEHDVMGRVTRMEQGGRVTLFEYDAIGNLTQQLDPEGRAYTYEYDNYYRLIKQTDPTGAVRAYAYDALNRIERIEDAQGRKTVFAYNKADVLISLTRHDEEEQLFAADGNGRLTEFTDELGILTKYEYDFNGNLKTLTDPLDKSIAWAYDHNNLPLTETDRRGNTYTKEYDALGRLTKSAIPMGVSLSYYYDKVGNLTAVKDGAGNLSSFAYDSLYQCTAFTDAYGNTTDYAYNTLGLVTEAKAPDGSAVSYAYDAYGNNTEIRYPNGTRAAYAYDKLDRLLEETSVGGVTTSYTYDARGNLTEAADSTGRGLAFAYDAYNRLLQETNLLGGTVDYAYDTFDRVTAMTTDLGAENRYEYDLIGRLVKTTDARGKVTEYTYDANSNLTAMLDGERAYGFTYDENGNLTERTLPLGLTQTARYDADNRITAQSDFKGAETTYAYNSLSLLESVTDRLNKTTAYEYDPLGNVSKQTTPDGVETRYAYDIMNRLAEVREPGARMAWYLYDDMGNLSVSRIFEESNLPPDGQNERRVRYGYTETNRLEEISTGGQAQERFAYTDTNWIQEVKLPTGSHIQYGHDAMGNVTGVSFTNASAGTQQLASHLQQYPTGAPIAKAYDTWGRLTDMTDALGAARYTYDKSGLLTKEEHSEGMNLAYEYDIYGDVTAITYPDGSTARYTRDALGRISALTDRDGGVTEYEYDENSNVTKLTRPGGTVTVNTYDDLDRLLTTETTDASGAPLEAYTYTYDAMDRIQTELHTDASGKQTSRAYTYDEAGMLLRFEEAKDGTTTTIDYAYDVFGNKILEEEQPAGITRGYAYDAQDRLTKIVENGSTAATYEYDADGNLIRKQDSAGATAYTYTADNKLATTTVNGKLMSSILYDGNGMKAFELLRKELPPDEHDETIIQRIKKHKEEKVEWEAENVPVTLHEEIPGEGIVDIETPKDEPETIQLPSTWISTPGEWEELIETSQMTEQQMKDAMNRTHIPAGALATYAPPLGTVLLDYADKVWQDLVSAVDIVIDFLYTEGEEIEIPGGTKQIDDSVFDQPKEPEYTIDPKYADLVVMEEELRANYLESSSYAILFETLPGGSSENVYYEPTRYLYDMTQEHPQVLAEFGNSPEMRTGYSYANNQRVSGGKDSLHYYLYDGRTSVSNLLSNGSVAASYSYDPFGMVLEGAPAQDRIFGFNGEEYTPQTGMIYLRARHYSPSDGRFTTQDTYLGNLMDTVSQNRYAYCGNDPVNFIDPSGYVTIAGPNSNSGSSAVGSNSSGSSSSTTFGQGGILNGGSSTGLDPGDYAPGAWASTGPKTINSYSDDSSGSRTYTSTTYSADGKSSTKVEIFVPDRYNPDRNPVAMTVTSRYGGVVTQTVRVDDIFGVASEPDVPIPLGSGRNSSVLQTPKYSYSAFLPKILQGKQEDKHYAKWIEELIQYGNDTDGYDYQIRYDFIMAAISKVGDSYEKTDCSKLVRSAIKAAGYSYFDGLNSHKQAKYADGKGWLHVVDDIYNESLAPGDLLFWSYKTCNCGKHWEEIHHVGIYLYTDENDDMWIIDSTPSKSGPKIQEIWGVDNKKYKISYYATPDFDPYLNEHNK